MKKWGIFTKLGKSKKDANADHRELVDRLEVFFLKEREELEYARSQMGDADGRIGRSLARADEDLATLNQMKRNLMDAK